MAEKSVLHDESILVVGLGRFGSSIAVALERLGHNVLAMDRDEQRAQKWSGRLTHVVEADASNPDALEQVGAADFSIAVVGVGTSLEASVLITANLSDMGVPQIWAKALSDEHKRILERIGAHHVVLPEADAGERVAHLVSGKLLDYISFEDDFTIVKMRPPKELRGFTVGEAQVRKKYGVEIIGVKTPGQEFQYAGPDTRISQHSVIIVSGHTDLLDQFAARP